MAEVGSLNVDLLLKSAKFREGMAKAKASMSKFEKSLVPITRKLKRLGKQATKVGATLSRSLSLPLAIIGGVGVKVFADFEQSMAKVQAVSGATADEIKALSKQAEDLGRSTRFSASQVAELELEFSKLGFTADQILKITEGTLDLALATGEELAPSAQVAGATLRGFGLAAEDMGRVVDVMASSFSSSALTLEKFKDSMKTVAPVSKAVGATLEQTTSVLSVLSSSGLDASTSGTSLRNIFIELSKKGISWKDAMNKIKGSQNKLKTATELFGKRSATAALIISDNTDEIDRLEEAYVNSGGAAKAMAAIMDDTLEGSMLKVKSALEGMAITLGKILAPLLRSVAEKISNFTNFITDLDESTKKSILIFVGLAATLGPIIFLIGKLTAVIAFLIPALTAIATGATVILGPITLAVVGLTALSVIAFSAWKQFNKLDTAQRDLADAMETAKKNVADETTELTKLTFIAENEVLTRNERLKAVKKLQEKYPDYLGNIEEEKILSGEASTEIDKVAKSILRKAQAIAIENKLAKISETRINAIIKRNEILGKTTGGIVIDAPKFVSPEFKKAIDAIAEADKSIALLLGTLGEYSDIIIETDDDNEKAGKGFKGLAEGAGDAEVKVKKLTSSFTDLAFLGKQLLFRFDIEKPILRFENKLTERFAKIKPPLIPAPDTSLFTQGMTNLELQFKLSSAKITEVAINLGDIIKQSLVDAISGVAENIGRLLSGAGSVEDVFIGLLSSVIGFVQSFGKALIAAGIGALAFKQLLLAPPAAIAAGIALTALAGVLKGVISKGPKGFAEGGLVFGETLGLVGEGRDTSRSNPEVIAPLDKLKGFLQPNDSGMGSRLIAEVTGEQLRFLLDKTDKARKFTGRR